MFQKIPYTIVVMKPHSKVHLDIKTILPFVLSVGQV